MSGNSLLCDTNVLIHLLSNNEKVVELLSNRKVYISSITELELYGKKDLTEQELRVIDELIEQCFIIDLLQPIKEIVKRLKQHYSIKLPDAIIVASSIYLDIPLVTFDNDFRNIKEVELILFEG